MRKNILNSAIVLLLAVALWMVATGGPTGTAGAAQTLCAHVGIDAIPMAVMPGSEVKASGALVSCSTGSEKVSLIYSISGPNGHYSRHSYITNLRAGETQRVDAPLTAPSDPGVYTMSATVLSESSVLDIATVKFTVR